MTKSNKEDSFIALLNEFLEEHYMDTNLTIEAVCKQLFVSRSKLHRLIKGHTDMSTREFINKYRLKKSLPLLEENMAINKIAYLNGYKDPKYFTKVFKKYYGVSPSKYALGKSIVNQY